MTKNSDTKKTISQLRQEIIDAKDHFNKIYLYSDHIVLVLPYIKNIEDVKYRLKRYIERSFDQVINVDLLTQYLVVWHYTALFDDHHKKYQHMQNFECL